MKTFFATVFVATALLGLSFSHSSEALSPDHIYDGATLLPIELKTVLSKVQPGQVIFVSEFHQVEKHHALQTAIIENLIQRGLQVNVGIEHFSHLEQQALDAYLRGNLTEEALVKTVKLSGFSSWKEQLLLPVRHGGWSYGLNAPRWLTAKINAVGYELLNPLEKQILPPDFALGSPMYKERLLEIMGMIHPGPGFENFFQAQSAWDDTSAWTLSELAQDQPQAVFVVLFGDFHIAYGGGLPDRFSLRSSAPTLSFSQFCVDGINAEAIEIESKPHVRYGQRADFVVPTLCNTP